jgi:truncated hemoglobin YjbI
MSDLPTFLAWFSGFAENIKTKPTAEQWARIVEKIEGIDPASSIPPMSLSQATAMVTAPEPYKPTNATSWRALFTATLMEMGFDDDSAKEMAARAHPDLSIDAAAAARSAAGPMN